MDYDYSKLVDLAKQWGNTVLAQGWINEHDNQMLSDVNSIGARSLFVEQQSRPLIVAFFGGTGVGKSSLINRLAGKEIARTGVERPTSREVTLYYHRSVKLQQLPKSLPIDKITTMQHDDDTQKNIFWIDMPDIDSTVQSNKQLVLNWLPHVDVLVYVVSPERYRDSKAWQLLVAEDGKHAWLFVLNHWDRGQSEQYDDLIKQLTKASFDNPVIIKTICNNHYSGAQQDQFQQLVDTLKSLNNQEIIRHIENRGEQIRKHELKQKLQMCLAKMGDDQAHQKLTQTWKKDWQYAHAVLSKGMAWPLQVMSSKYAEKQTRLFDGWLKNKVAVQAQKSVDIELWDEWAQSRFDDELDKIILAADQYHMPVLPIRQNLQPLREHARKKIKMQAELGVRTALINPGNRSQRLLMKVVGFFATVLPLTAMGWVGYQVFNGYYDSDINQEAYLGVDFAIHSILLIGIAWLLPFFAKKQIKPSSQKVALKGLTQGIETGLATLEAEVIQAITENEKLRGQHVNAATILIARCDATTKTKETDNPTLSRMMI